MNARFRRSNFHCVNGEEEEFLIFFFFGFLLCFSPSVRRRLFYVNIRRIHIFVIMRLRARVRNEGEKERQVRASGLNDEFLFSWF